MKHIEYFSSNPESQQIFEEINHAMRAYDIAEMSREGVVEVYKRLILSNGIQRFVEIQLERIKDDFEFSPAWISGTEIPIIANKHSVLSVRCLALNDEIEAIYAAPGDLIFTLLSTDPVQVSVYQAVKEGYQCQQLEETQILQSGQSVRINEGQAFLIDGGNTHALLARLMLGLKEYTPVYDAQTLRFMSMVSLNPSNSRWGFMARTAALLRSEAAVPILDQLTRHHDYDVRWKALQGMFVHDTPRAMQVLAAFCNDPSEHISEQARLEHARITQLINAGH